MATLILLRHGQSEWNEKNLFTGWHDVDLTAKGEAEARAGGHLLTEAGVLPDVCFTSLQVRAIRTAELALAAAGRSWIPVHRHWRLNERHYGALQGLNKAETTERYGAEQVHVWRRSYDTPPPALELDDERHPRHDVRYADLAPEQLPATECLADVVARPSPTGTTPSSRTSAGPGRPRGRSRQQPRALVKHLESIGDDAIAELNIPTGIPRAYELDDDLRPVDVRYLG
jgi:2,3-bisphosphoglycerate-dependent phosphoglycerate mutase